MFPHSVQSILSVLDDCAASYSFPMLDNGYVYLAATRLALFRSDAEWAITTEVFGFSPRTGLPDLQIGTFASSLARRKTPADYATPEAHAAYLQRQPHDEALFVYPFEEGGWLEEECMAPQASMVRLRAQPITVPSLVEYAGKGIVLESADQAHVFEFCRWVAGERRSDVLATDEEQRWHVPADLVKILELDEWHHPDLVNDELPSQTETFQQLAQVLVEGDVTLYKPTKPANTHWKHWPEGGTL
ncbi:MAG: DUF7003 family protein [Prosthecobacter sp.]